MRKPRVVIDTNIFISGLIIPHGYPYMVLSLWKNDNFLLLVNDLLISEMVEVLSRPKIQHKYGVDLKQIGVLVALLDKFADKVEKNIVNPVKVRDKKDQYILDLALSGKADYLITGDEDLLSLASKGELQPLIILNPKDFVLQLN